MAIAQTAFQLPAEIETLYNQYSPMLYGMALYLLKTEQDAEELMTETFTAIYHKKSLHHHPAPAIEMVRILMGKAHNMAGISPAKPMFRLKQFEKAPLLNQLLCLQLSLHEICTTNNLSRQQVATKLRHEFLWLRNKGRGNAAMWIA